MTNALKQVVMNADDMGLHRGINQGIRQAHQHGIVTSTSLVACGEAFDDAIETLSDCPNLGVGVHMTLVEERPVLQPHQIPSLVQSDGKMRASYKEFAKDWLLGKIRREDVQRELEAQVERVIAAGVIPHHIDGHQHVHCLPGVWRLVTEIARKLSIEFVRLPMFDDLWRSSRHVSDLLTKSVVNMLSSTRRYVSVNGIRHANAIAGCAVSGNMTQGQLEKILSRLSNGITEVMVHPGVDTAGLRNQYQQWGTFNWVGDLEAVTSEQIIRRCQDGSFVLTNFRELVSNVSK